MTAQTPLGAVQSLDDQYWRAVELFEAGRFAQTEALCREILARDPRYTDAVHLLAVLAYRVGRHQIALQLVDGAIAHRPGIAGYHNTRGAVLEALRRLEEAMREFHHVLELAPACAEPYCNLSGIYRALGDLPRAIHCAREAIRLRPGFADAYNNLGNALRDTFQLEEAIVVYRQVVECDPRHSVGHSNLAAAEIECARYADAAEHARRAVAVNPAHPDAFGNLGNALKEIGDPDGAVEAYGEALRRRPDWPAIENNLGNVLKDRGEIREAIGRFGRAVDLDPGNAVIHSNLVFCLQFDSRYDAAAVAAEQARWNRLHSDPLARFRLPHPNDRDPDRKLRIGYVSPDFYDHAVLFFMMPLLSQHDRSQVEVFCYSSVVRPDGFTDRIREKSDRWRDIHRLSEAQAAELVRADGIDILIDLAMHTAFNRLELFAMKPAPVQASWLAYPGSTGLDTIDYRITDRFMEPPGAPGLPLPERPVRMPDSWCCYGPALPLPDVGPLPADVAGFVTFGSMNNPCKFNEAVAAVWAAVLAAVHGSRLLMVCPVGVRQAQVWAMFAQHGIPAERIELVPKGSWNEYMARIARVDIALDPFPGNGMTTTCHMLWMGVPVLTIPGSAPASRAGLSLLSAIGLQEFAANSPAELVQIACALAGDLPRLRELRRTMRDRMQPSPLMDAPRFARHFEAALRGMWHTWCEGTVGAV